MTRLLCRILIGATALLFTLWLTCRIADARTPDPGASPSPTATADNQRGNGHAPGDRHTQSASPTGHRPSETSHTTPVTADSGRRPAGPKDAGAKADDSRQKPPTPPPPPQAARPAPPHSDDGTPDTPPPSTPGTGPQPRPKTTVRAHRTAPGRPPTSGD